MPDGGLLLMRFANIAFAAVGVVLHVPAGDELAGRTPRRSRCRGDRRPRPQGHTYFSRALNDGLAFAAGTALLWAAVRCLRRPRPAQSVRPRRDGGRRRRHADGDDAARGRRRRCGRARSSGTRLRPSRGVTGVRGAATVAVDRARSGGRAVRVVLRPHPAALRRRRGVDVPARALRSRATREHRRRAHVRVGCGRTCTTGWPRRRRCRGRGRASPTSSAVVAVVGLVVALVRPRSSDDAGGRSPCASSPWRSSR